jgi:phospholipase/carboxylesterase
MLETVQIQNNPHPQYSIIWMHGLGADGHDFAPIAEQLQLPMAVRFVFPHAPVMPVTINGGYQMRAWYDLYALDSLRVEDAAGIHASQASITALIQQEVQRGIPEQHILLAGFSQGGAIALHTALRHPRALAGVLALSTYLPLAASLPKEQNPANANTPILMAHGNFDSVIRPELARNSKGILEQAGYNVAWHEYPMAHSVCNEEVRDIRSFIIQTLQREETRRNARLL